MTLTRSTPTSRLSATRCSMAGRARELGSLQQHGGVDVERFPAVGAGQRRRLAREARAVGTAQRGVAVRVAAADVARLERAQDRVHDGMQQHVGVRVPHGAMLRRHPHAPSISGRRSRADGCRSPGRRAARAGFLTPLPRLPVVLRDHLGLAAGGGNPWRASTSFTSLIIPGLPHR